VLGFRQKWDFHSHSLVEAKASLEPRAPGSPPSTVLGWLSHDDNRFVPVLRPSTRQNPRLRFVRRYMNPAKQNFTTRSDRGVRAYQVNFATPNLFSLQLNLPLRWLRADSESLNERSGVPDEDGASWFTPSQIKTCDSRILQRAPILAFFLDLDQKIQAWSFGLQSHNHKVDETKNASLPRPSVLWLDYFGVPHFLRLYGQRSHLLPARDCCLGRHGNHKRYHRASFTKEFTGARVLL